jgi:hypothetical protein
MSDIITNAKRYGTNNTFRSDSPGSTRGNARINGGTSIGFDCSGLVYHILRESGYNVPSAPSSVMIDDKNFGGGWATAVDPEKKNITPGALVYFSGHVGLVQSYDPVTKTGQFLSMTGKENSGSIKSSEPFTTDKQNRSTYWGGARAFKGFAEVKPELYDRTLDQHANGANPNTPVFNIPEATNAGFITLPGNGGFPIVKTAADLSARVDVAAASGGIVLPPPIDLPNANTAFATALAVLESNGQPNNGYGGWARDDQGIGAIGRYGFRSPSLKAIGWMDAKGNWTDKALANGVSSPESFRDSPAAQEIARVEYMGKLKNEMKANGSWEMIGKTVEGHVVTEAGLIAAAWKEGAGAVDKFFSGDSVNKHADTNIMFRLDRFAETSLPGQTTGQGSPATPTPAALAGGFWEFVASSYASIKDYLGLGDPAGTHIPPATASQATDGTRPPTATQATAPAPIKDITRHGDGSTTLSFYAKADSDDGLIKKGDLVSSAFDPDGQLSYYSVRHTEGGVTTVEERIPVAGKGEAVATSSRWVGNTLTFQGQWDSTGNLVGNRYTVDGLTYTRSIGADGQTQWLDPNGLNANERIQQSYDREAERLLDANPGLDPNGLTPGERIQQSYDQETQRLFTTHPGEESSATVSSRTLSVEELRAIETGLAQAAAAGAGTRYVDAGSHTDNTVLNDGGSGADQPFNVIDIPASDLASHFIGSQGAGQLAGFDVRPFNENSNFLVGADGSIVAEINRLSNGYYQVKDLSGNAVYVSANNGSVLTQEKYEQAQAQALDAAQAAQEAQAGQAANAVGLMNSIIGLQHWDDMSDLRRTAAVASIYNAVNKITGNALPGDLGSVAGALGVLNALDKGDVGGVVYSGLSLVETLTYDAATKMGWVTANMPGGADFMPGLGLALALESGDPMSVLAAAANFIPVYGQFISVAISVFGSMLVDEPDIPTREGLAHAQWDAAGNTLVITDQDIEGGGPTATGWMNSLVDGLQTQLAGMHDISGNSYALVPDLLPAVGFRYDPDGLNLGNGARGFVYLQWIDENGQTQTRYYDGAGNRGDGTGETLAGDFMQHAAGAIAPAWQVQTALAHYQQGQGVHLPNAEASLPQELADGIHQTLQALTLALPAEPALNNALIDIDGDGYLEQTQWLATNQQILGVDANGDGQIGTNELLSLNGPAALNSLNSLNWLDANSDQILNASDPAFPALRLWLDVNADADSSDETQTMAQAGIVAIDFGSNPPAIVRADGSRTSLTTQTLLGDVLGIQYQAVVGGVLQLDEQQTGSATATLHAVNTREFDGQADHIHGGDAAVDSDTSGESTVDAGDTRLVTTTANTIATRSAQTSAILAANDARMRTGVAGAVLAGQSAGQTPGAAEVSSNGIVFVPAGAASPGAQMREATEAMVRSAEAGSLVPLMALALGAGAVQWPTLAPAATPPQASDASSASAPSATAESIDWQIWDGSRFSSAPNSSTVGTLATSPLAGAEISRPLNTNPSTTAEDGIHASNWPPAHMDHAPSAINLVANGVLSTSAPMPILLVTDNDSLPGGGVLPNQQTSDVVLDFPQTHGEQASSHEDTGLRFLETLLLANDSTVNAPAFPDQPSLRITSVFAPVHGSVSLQVNIQGAMEVVFLPETNYHGPASFDYTVTDQYGLSNNARVNLSIAAVNDAPVTRGETASGNEDTILLFSAAGLLANDSDVDTAVDEDLLRITRVGLAQHGQVFLQPDGTVRFEPDANYNGPAQFSYWVGDRDAAQIASGEGHETPATVNLTVLAVNDLPVVTGELMDSDEDIILNINPALLLANDTDVDTATTNAQPAQVLSITAVGNAQHGSIALLPGGTLQFTPELNYFGAAGFSYTVDDGHGGQVQGQVVVNLAPVNDAPDVLGETVIFNEDEIQTFTQAQFLANDSDVDNPHSDLQIVSVENATHGTVSLNPDGTVRFAPDADYFGAARFTYTVSDGSGGFTVGLASLDIAAVNDAPRLAGEALTLNEDTDARFTVDALLANDADVDNLHSDMTVMAAGNASHGSVQIVAGEIVFTPDLNYNGTASFTYTVSDGEGGTSEATVNLTFNPVNDAPVANSELVWGKRDVSYTLTQAALLANDTDVESPTALHVSAISNVQHGAAVLNADGSVRFTPDAGYTGRGSFDYTVEDPDGAGSTATAQIDFSRVNVNPTATDDSFTGYEDIPFSITQTQLLVNDSDADNAAADLRVTAVGGGSNGMVSLQADGTVRFVPAADFNGVASFSYQVSDGDGGQTWATARLTVQAVNDAPVIDEILYGRPVYGYLPGAVATQDIAIYDEAQALALANSGSLYSRTFRMNIGDQEGYTAPIYDYAQLTNPTYYRNGHMRPVFVETLDATYQDPDNLDRWMNPGDGTRPVDDPYRQNGYIVAYDPDGDSAAVSFSIASGPQHGHAWANQYTNLSTPRNYDHTMAPSYAVGQTGAWQYYSQRGDPYSGADNFTIAVTDSGGATTYVTLNTAQVGSIAPVVLDLDGNGLQYAGLADSRAYFDVDYSGKSQHLAWSAPGDALLARDIGGDGQINRIDEISFTGYLAGAKTDLEGLAAFDSNGNHQLDAGDDKWKEFGAWQDKNGNGFSEAGEFKTLDEIGITQIGLQSNQQVRQAAQGVTELGQSYLTWADGRTGAVGDVVFAVDGSTPAPAASSAPAVEALPTTVQSEAQDASDARLMRMALLFNQMVNTVDSGAHEALGFVPIAPDAQWQDIALMAEQHAQLQTPGA